MLGKIGKVGIAAAVLFAAGVSVETSSAAVILNQVYSGGGTGSGTPAFQQDYVELYNTGASAVDLNGYLIQYSAAGASSVFGGTIFAFGPGSTIPANGYLTINSGTPGTAGAVNTAFNGANTSVGLSASSGAVRVLDPSSNVVDLLGYGTIPASTSTPPTVKFETAAAASPTSTAVALGRTNFIDTDNNSADFSSMTPNPIASAGSIAAPALTPEPASLSLLAVGGAALLTRRRK